MLATFAMLDPADVSVALMLSSVCLVCALMSFPSAPDAGPIDAGDVDEAARLDGAAERQIRVGAEGLLGRGLCEGHGRSRDDEGHEGDGSHDVAP